MELSAFFRFLYKNLKVLILIPVVTVSITYYLVKSLPDSYISEGQIATGIVDKSDEINLTNAPPLQQSEIEQKFSNLIQLMQMQKLLRLVSYKLIIHDLTDKTTFKKLSPQIDKLSPVQREQLVALAVSKYKSQQPLVTTNPQEAILNEVISSMHYDSGSIKDKLNVSRLNKSDYINVSFESANPFLSEFVVNTACVEFINYYTSIVTKTGEKSVNYLSKLLHQKQSDLNNKMSILKYYKIRNNVLNLPEQAKTIFGQMIEVENKQSETEKDIASLSATIAAIDRRFNPRDRKYFEMSASRINAEIVDYKEKSKALSDKYVDNDFDPVYKKMYDSIQVLTLNKINEATDENIFSPLVVKQELISKKLTLQTELELAKNSVSTLERLHSKLFIQFKGLVPFEASIQSYERDIEIASQEYLDILDRYNNTSMQTTFIAKLKLTQVALPGALQPSKKMLLILMSGIISFVFCIIVLFALFYFDGSVQSAKLLANKTSLPVIGQLNTITNQNLNIKELWGGGGLNKPEFKLFKDQLRAIRLELNPELQEHKILAITSLAPNEGKTFLAVNLGYTYAVTNKKVLLIDGNFINPKLTESASKEGLTYIEDFLRVGDITPFQDTKPGITIMGNRAEDISVLEIINEETIRLRLEQLKTLFDLIVIENPALTSTEASKEWFLFAEKVIGVFEHNEYITDPKAEQLTYIQAINSKFIGWVFNKLPAIKQPKAKK
jgi:capsular polysaccharide biosynthesis protein